MENVSYDEFKDRVIALCYVSPNSWIELWCVESKGYKIVCAKYPKGLILGDEEKDVEHGLWDNSRKAFIQKLKVPQTEYIELNSSQAFLVGANGYERFTEEINEVFIKSAYRKYLNLDFIQYCENCDTDNVHPSQEHNCNLKVNEKC